MRSNFLIFSIFLFGVNFSHGQGEDPFLNEKIAECSKAGTKLNECLTFWSNIVMTASKNGTTAEAEYNKHLQLVGNADYLTAEREKCNSSQNPTTCREYWNNVQASATASGRTCQQEHEAHLNRVVSADSNQLYLVQEKAKCADSPDRPLCEQYWLNIQNIANSKGITYQAAHEAHVASQK